MRTIKCKECERQFKLRMLYGTRGKCPSCGALVPVSDYCAYIPERRWWRLFSAAPIWMKLVILLCSVVCAFFLPGQVLTAIYPLVEDTYYYKGLHRAMAWLGFLLMPILVPMIWGAVRGRIPYVGIGVFVFFLGYAFLGGCLTGEVVGLVVLLFLFSVPILLMPLYFMPSVTRWRNRCREERCSFSVAVKSGADLTSLEVRKHPLNIIAICIYLILVLGVLWISAWDELRFFCPYSQLWK